MKHLALFASGTGSNARKIIEHFQDHKDIRVALVVSNKKSAPVLEMAAGFDIPTLVISRSEFYDTTHILEKLDAYSVDFVVLAGFLWLIPPYLVDAFDQRMVNIHPALLPRYGGKGMYGMHVHRQVRENRDQQSGITIHYVNKAYDEGSTIFQATCPIHPTDTPEDIAHKVQHLEHRYFAHVIESLLTGTALPQTS